MLAKMKLTTGQVVFRIVALAVAVTLFSGPAWAQETSEDTRQSRIVKKKKKKKSGDQEVKVEHVDGKVVIVTGDGEKHVIDLDKLQGDGNIRVELKSEDDNGDKKSRGRAILVGPGGNQEVIFDSDAEGVLSFEFDELDGTGTWQQLPGSNVEGRVQFTLDGNDYMIGINCDVAGETLKTHLDLAAGLIVKEVYDDSAAAEAGVQQHDILIRANGEDLQDLDDLIEIIQDAGKEEDKVKLKIIRKGDKVSVSVTPTKRENTFMENSVIDLTDMNDNILADRVQIQRALPGFIQARGSSDDLKAEIAELREMIKQLRKDMKDKD